MKTYLKRLRQTCITKPIFKRAQKMLPTLSDTEREALQVGTLSWEAEILSGKPDWKKLLNQKETVLTQKEREFINGPLEELCALCNDWDITFKHKDIPKNIWNVIKKNGFLGLIIPEQYGGLNFSARAISDIVIKISSKSPSAAVAIIVPNSLGPGELLMMFGTEKQKQYYLPRLADGREIPAFALTSLDAGSDAAAMTDTGVICKGIHNGKEIIGMKLSWQKRYISLGPICSVLGLAFKLYDPDHLIGDETNLGITLALVPTNLPGITIGKRHYPAMQAFPNGPNQGKDVFLPLDAIIGGKDNIGKGWKMLVTALAAGRGIMLPAMAVSAMKLATQTTSAYAQIRKQFGIPLAKMEGVQEVLADITAHTFTQDAARKLTADIVDQGEKPAIISAIMKYHATEKMRTVINHAMDVHAGRAICDGPKNYLASPYRAIPIAITVEGANILTRTLMIYGQGAIRCHPHLQEEIKILSNPNPDNQKQFEQFENVLLQHIKNITKITARATLSGWTKGILNSAPIAGKNARYYRKITHLSAILALISETALITIGGNLKKQQMISARLGDAIAYLYFASAILRQNEIKNKPQQEQPIVKYALELNLYQAEKALKQTLVNFPSAITKYILYTLIAPWGLKPKIPADQTKKNCAKTITKAGNTRNKIIHGIYLGKQKDPLQTIENAFQKINEINNIKNKKIEKKISAKDKKIIQNAEKIIRNALEVDHFNLEEITQKQKK